MPLGSYFESAQGGRIVMKDRWGEWAMLMTGLLLLASSMFSPPVRAQSGEISKPGFGKSDVKALPPGKPTPRTADGHPDLSGIWIDGYTGSFDLTAERNPLQGRYDRNVTPQEPPVFQRWVPEKIKRMGTLVAAGPCLDCEPLGPIGIFIKGLGYEIEILQTPQKVVVLSELDTTYRFIWIDGRQHKKDPDPQFNGDAVAHWEGDTLVVDVTALDVHQWLSPTPTSMLGWFPSDVAHIVERISRPDSNNLVYQYTVYDPKVLTRPWVSVPQHYSLSREPMVEYYCTNNTDYGSENPGGPKYISVNGLDERYFDEQEYEQLKKEFPEPGNK
jgi:hypothetical protein